MTLENGRRDDSAGPSAAVGGTASSTSRLERLIDFYGSSQDGWLGDDSPEEQLNRFLAERSPLKAAAIWLQGSSPEAQERPLQTIAIAIAQLDELITSQVNAILHHPDFQQLEASWRGIHYLVRQTDSNPRCKIKLLSVSWDELAKDQRRAIEFDQSQLFKKVYENEFGMPGGEPFGLLIGDYQVRPKIGDIDALRGIMGTAAAAFAPFVAAAHPEMFGLDDLGAMQRSINFDQIFAQKKYTVWNSLRNEPDARFVGLTVPRVLWRLPYVEDNSRIDGFCFGEEVGGPDRSRYLWGNAGYAFAGVVLRSFIQSGWLAAIRGVHRDFDQGGLVTELPVHDFSTDGPGIAQKTSTEVAIIEDQEKQLSDLGFIPLSDCKNTEFSAFYSCQSIQRPTRYTTPEANLNARISTMLHYMLCVSRFAHYIKRMMRDKTGSFTSAEDCESMIHDWLANYVSLSPDASDEVKASRPLREATVEIREIPGRPGSYKAGIKLWPHFELDELNASIKIDTDLKMFED